MKKKHSFLIVCIALFFSAIFFIVCIILFQRTKIANLENDIISLEAEYVPVKFRISQRSGTMITAEIKFYNVQGDVVGELKKTWEGNELFIDFTVYDYNNHILAFPASVFTDSIPSSQGTSVFEYYEEAGFPLIYESKKNTDNQKEMLKEVFLLVKNKDDSKRNSFGSAVHDVQSIGLFPLGTIYKIIVRTKGGLEIVED